MTISGTFGSSLAVSMGKGISSSLEKQRRLIDKQTKLKEAREKKRAEAYQRYLDKQESRAYQRKVTLEAREYREGKDEAEAIQTARKDKYESALRRIGRLESKAVEYKLPDIIPAIGELRINVQSDYDGGKEYVNDIDISITDLQARTAKAKMVMDNLEKEKKEDVSEQKRIDKLVKEQKTAHAKEKAKQDKIIFWRGNPVLRADFEKYYLKPLSAQIKELSNIYYEATDEDIIEYETDDGRVLTSPAEILIELNRLKIDKELAVRALTPSELLNAISGGEKKEGNQDMKTPKTNPILDEFFRGFETKAKRERGID